METPNASLPDVMNQSYLDTLYTLCFQQMLRYKISPVYVEKRILDENVNFLRRFLLKQTERLRQKIQESKEIAVSSYMTWDKKYYEKRSELHLQALEELEKKIKETESMVFLKENFSTLEFSVSYPDILLGSEHRASLWTLWSESA